MTAGAVPAAAVRAVPVVDHKRIAARLMLVCVCFFVVSGAMALAMRTELARPGLQLLSTSEYDQVFTLHGSGMVYLVMTPLALALGLYLVPLQIGANGLAFPALAVFGLWSLVAGGLTMDAGMLTAHGAAAAGWTAFLPLSDRSYSRGSGSTCGRSASRSPPCRRSRSQYRFWQRSSGAGRRGWPCCGCRCSAGRCWSPA